MFKIRSLSSNKTKNIEKTNNDLRFNINILPGSESEWACGAAIWYDRLLSDTEISEIETYLVDKYYDSTEIVEEQTTTKIFYTVAVSDGVFDISGSLQPQLDFSANQSYVFDQSDPTNAGYQIVFGSEPDAASNYTTGKTIMGTPGQPGAYTQLQLPE